MPGLLDDIITDHAGTVMGGSHERSSPCTPFWQRHFKFGKSSSQRSKTNSGAAQSSPISMTRGRISSGTVRKVASRVDLGKSRFFKLFRCLAMNAHECAYTKRRTRWRWPWSGRVHFAKGIDISTAVEASSGAEWSLPGRARLGEASSQA